MAPVVHMQQGLVAHEEGPHELQGGNLQREVEGGDQAHRPERPPVAVALLACVITRNAKRLGGKPHLQRTRHNQIKPKTSFLPCLFALDLQVPLMVRELTILMWRLAIPERVALWWVVLVMTCLPGLILAVFITACFNLSCYSLHHCTQGITRREF